LFAIRHGDILVNQVLGSPLEGGIGNVYLRRRTRAGVSAIPLIGPGAASRFTASAEGAAWEGAFDGLEYRCTLRLAPRRRAWAWTIEVRNTTGTRVGVDALLAQDLGIANEAAVRTSELYTSQYIDHTVLEDTGLGYLLCSRQNLPQGGAYPWIVHGCLEGTVGYLTDGFQFYGLDYKATGVPAALRRRTLPNRVYQYEFAMPTLQSRALALQPSGEGEITFFAAFEPDHPKASGPVDIRRAGATATAIRGVRTVARADRPPRGRSEALFDAPRLFASVDLAPSALERAFGPEWRHVERRNGRTLSFFHGTQQHVTLRAKERVMERPTGHIMRSGRDLAPSDDILSVTAWMFGVFGSQLAIGNTSFHKLLSVCRNPLNVLKSSGIRIFLRAGADWELLGVPSAFEVGHTTARWIYHDGRRTLTVRAGTSPDGPAYRLSVQVERGGPVELLISHNVVVGTNEYDDVPDVTIDAAGGRIELRPAHGGRFRERYPDATFWIVSPHADRIEAIGRDGLLYADGEDRGGAFVVVKTRPVDRFDLVLTGSVLSRQRAAASANDHAGAATTSSPEIDAWAALAPRSRLAGGRGRFADDVARLDDVLRWYAHDAMVHYTTPHGLEQYSGAAWGLRDVCQGPAELLVATGNLEPLRHVLRTVYEHQSRQTGDWPQWFMFDRHRDVRAGDSHADIIHWPLKALCDYVEASNDLAILDEPVAWTDDKSAAVTEETDAVATHAERQIDRIERDCISGTALPVFGGGDWEDTLQPADRRMAERLVSAWTTELAYQTLGRYRVVCERAGRTAMAERLAELCARIGADFERDLLPDGIVAGLVHFGPDSVEYFLHPRDRKTGVDYRLLPMTRGMISGLFSPDQAERHLQIIERHLTFPDGVRLMDRPMTYRGGPSRYFLRAESAASFGREIGLQYVHAHIRYIEAMAKVGRADAAFEGLMAICPIRLELDVPNALPRQSNSFFSSSDAAFDDRRQASRDFDRLRTGQVGVKGGWRVYSSGPGIYLNQVVSNVLGLRTFFDDVVFDPVLPRRADGLTFDREVNGRPVRYRYRVTGEGVAPSEVRVNGRAMIGRRATDNPYRAGGLLIAKADFLAALDRHDNVVEIVV
jgi:CRISPR-associated protein Csx3